ncbi:hypothetical protein [Pseudoxanthomonas mexicana]|uniref:hypothetical protein n=1 Tax=Pseudoxanthomonas mexicana TaxID=128785 RepID=UPI00398AE0BD
MNRLLRIALPVLSVLLLPACAGTQQMARSTPAAQPQNQTVITTDGAYIAYVERIAKRRGIQVNWVNPPLKRQPAQ